MPQSGTPTRPRRPRVALVAIGIGRFQRGFERYFSDLAELLRPELDLRLYAGAPGEGRRVPPGLGTLGRLAARLPVGRTETEYRTYKHDCLAYGLAMAADLARDPVDIVHAIDPPLSKVLERLLPWLPGRPRLIYSNGTAWPVHLCPRRAFIHHIQEGSLQQALAAGDPPGRNRLIPCGVNMARFGCAEPRAALRQRLGIVPERFVVLMVGAVKRPHKRVDHVIDEFAALPGEPLLWIDGKIEDESLVAEAQRRLGSRVRVGTSPSAEVGQLYAMADVMVHAALDESFGLVIVEALSTGLPVLAHDSPHFRWLTGEPRMLIDMARPGLLGQRLAVLQQAHSLGGEPFDAAGQAARAELAARLRQRFDWPQLKADYLSLYAPETR